MVYLDFAKSHIETPTFLFDNRTKSSFFTKGSAKMNFKEAIYFILKGIRKSLQIELDEWFNFIRGGEKSMTKQAFSQLRQKIKPEAFVQLNEGFISWFYDDDNFKRYRSYRLLSIDGSITEIPNTAINRDHFGYHHNQSNKQQARAMATVIYDIENDCILESDIRTWKAAERTVAKELIERLGNKGYKNDLFIFDRGYPSDDMFEYLESKKLKYLMKLKQINSTQNLMKLTNLIRLLPVFTKTRHYHYG